MVVYTIYLLIMLHVHIELHFELRNECESKKLSYMHFLMIFFKQSAKIILSFHIHFVTQRVTIYVHVT